MLSATVNLMLSANCMPSANLMPSLPRDYHWQLILEPHPPDAASALATDDEWLARSGQLIHKPVLRIWRCRRALIATSKESRMPGFNSACDHLGECGWPVHVRRTGGSCVPQCPGVINLSMIYPAPEHFDIEDSYRLLGSPLMKFLREYGLSPDYGNVPGSFCDGKYNLQVGGRKIVGTAQRRRFDRRHNRHYVLAQACLLLDLDLADATGRVNELYRLGGSPTKFSEAACVTLRDLVPADHWNSGDIRRQFVRSVSSQFTIRDTLTN